jgi:hypothetical protein
LFCFAAIVKQQERKVTKHNEYRKLLCTARKSEVADLARISVRERAFTPHGPAGTAVSSNIITRKADAKLSYVADIMTKALGAHFAGQSRRFLDKTLEFKGLKFIDCLNLRYRMENRLFAILYDLLIETSVPAQNAGAPRRAVRIEAELKGKLFVKDAIFVLKACSDCDERRADAILALLDNDLLRERILALDLADIVLSFDPGRAEWTIRCRSIIGSTTWNLIPPITQLIKPKEDECVKLIEFFELAASCVGSI